MYIHISNWPKFESILSSSKKDIDDHILSGQFQVISATHDFDITSGSLLPEMRYLGGNCTCHCGISYYKNIAQQGFKTDSFHSLPNFTEFNNIKKKMMNLKRAICFNLFSEARRAHGDGRFTRPTAILHATGFGLPGYFEDWPWGLN